MLGESVPGQLIDVGGYRLCVQIMGTGRPAVVMDSGLASTSLFYAAVQPEIARFTRVLTYDRAGYPRSDPAPLNIPRTSQQIVSELRTALQQLEVAPPYLLVGHSFGAINMLTYALNHPTEVAGLIFVDPSHPEMFSRLPGAPSPQQTAQGFQFFVTVARLGILKAFAPILSRQLLPRWRNLPPGAWRELVALAGQPSSYRAAMREAQAASESFAKARARQGALNDLPLMVLTAADLWVTGRETPMKRAGLALHKELAQLSSCGKHITVENSGHTIPVDRPDAVIQAVQEMVALVRLRPQESRSVTDSSISTAAC